MRQLLIAATAVLAWWLLATLAYELGRPNDTEVPVISARRNVAQRRAVGCADAQIRGVPT